MSASGLRKWCVDGRLHRSMADGQACTYHPSQKQFSLFPTPPSVGKRKSRSRNTAVQPEELQDAPEDPAFDPNNTAAPAQRLDAAQLMEAEAPTQQLEQRDEASDIGDAETPDPSPLENLMSLGRRSASCSPRAGLRRCQSDQSSEARVSAVVQIERTTSSHVSETEPVESDSASPVCEEQGDAVKTLVNEVRLLQATRAHLTEALADSTALVHRLRLRWTLEKINRQLAAKTPDGFEARLDDVQTSVRLQRRQRWVLWSVLVFLAIYCIWRWWNRADSRYIRARTCQWYGLSRDC